MNATLNVHSATVIPFPDRPSIQITLKGAGQDARDLTGDPERLAEFARSQGTTQVFAPKVADARGRVARPESFKLSMVAGVACKDSVSSEGTSLRAGDALCLATGDCPVVVMYSHERPHMAVAAHAGRDAVMKGVIGNMLRMLGSGHRVSRRSVRAYIALGIGGKHFAHPFDHPEHGLKNRLLVRRIVRRFGAECLVDEGRGAIRLDVLIKRRCMELGIPGGNVAWDRRDTFADTLPDDSHAWHSHRRGSKERNLVFVRFGYGI